eukprot:GHVN01020380.1.p1 GENE.GHVN01020380.1~~GHVN01020380.1.p1  ORF type:complete len:965 (+),score=50.08 GHVN01020380.1:93-2987(+)
MVGEALQSTHLQESERKAAMLPCLDAGSFNDAALVTCVLSYLDAANSIYLEAVSHRFGAIVEKGDWCESLVICDVSFNEDDMLTAVNCKPIPKELLLKRCAPKPRRPTLVPPLELSKIKANHPKGVQEHLSKPKQSLFHGIRLPLPRGREPPAHIKSNVPQPVLPSPKELLLKRRLVTFSPTNTSENGRELQSSAGLEMGLRTAWACSRFCQKWFQRFSKLKSVTIRCERSGHQQSSVSEGFSQFDCCCNRYSGDGLSPARFYQSSNEIRRDCADVPGRCCCSSSLLPVHVMPLLRCAKLRLKRIKYVYGRHFGQFVSRPCGMLLKKTVPLEKNPRPLFFRTATPLYFSLRRLPSIVLPRVSEFSVIGTRGLQRKAFQEDVRYSHRRAGANSRLYGSPVSTWRCPFGRATSQNECCPPIDYTLKCITQLAGGYLSPFVNLVLPHCENMRIKEVVPPLLNDCFENKKFADDTATRKQRGTPNVMLMSLLRTGAMELIRGARSSRMNLLDVELVTAYAGHTVDTVSMTSMITDHECLSSILFLCHPFFSRGGQEARICGTQAEILLSDIAKKLVVRAARVDILRGAVERATRLHCVPFLGRVAHLDLAKSAEENTCSSALMGLGRPDIFRLSTACAQRKASNSRRSEVHLGGDPWHDNVCTDSCSLELCVKRILTLESTHRDQVDLEWLLTFFGTQKATEGTPPESQPSAVSWPFDEDGITNSVVSQATRTNLQNFAGDVNVTTSIRIERTAVSTSVLRSELAKKLPDLAIRLGMANKPFSMAPNDVQRPQRSLLDWCEGGALTFGTLQVHNDADPLYLCWQSERDYCLGRFPVTVDLHCNHLQLNPCGQRLSDARRTEVLRCLESVESSDTCTDIVFQSAEMEKVMHLFNFKLLESVDAVASTSLTPPSECFKVRGEGERRISSCALDNTHGAQLFDTCVTTVRRIFCSHPSMFQPCVTFRILKV